MSFDTIGFCLVILLVFTYEPMIAQTSVYRVAKSTERFPVDGKWDKRQWQQVDSVFINNYMGELPKFKPVAHAKLQYDEAYLYLIFRVHDCYVSSVVQHYNGPVSGDACVEFFFSPDISFPLRYFNLEINAGGTPLMRYNADGQKTPFSTADLQAIEIAHSLPRVVDPAIAEPVTWTIECKIPLQVLEKYGGIALPRSGVEWRANFYKTASKSTNPHWITWVPVEHEVPNFHLPEFFGVLAFD